MAGTILENLSGRKLTTLVVSLLICQVVCFLIGGLIGEWLVNCSSARMYDMKFLISAPIPSSVQTILGTVCKDIPGSYNDTTKWVYSRGVGKCQTVDQNYFEHPDVGMANNIVFVFQMPLPREGKVLDYSRWQQNLIGILQTDIAYHKNVLLDAHMVVTLDARMAYRNKGDADGDWKYYASALEQRDLDCTGENVSGQSELA